MNLRIIVECIRCINNNCHQIATKHPLVWEFNKKKRINMVW